MHVAQLAVERRDRGRSQQIGGDHPGQILDLAEAAADSGQSGGHDGLVERAQINRQHDAKDDLADFHMRERLVPLPTAMRGSGVGGGFGRGHCVFIIAASPSTSPGRGVRFKSGGSGAGMSAIDA
jgi:hypothetical protein